MNVEKPKSDSDLEKERAELKARLDENKSLLEKIQKKGKKGENKETPTSNETKESPKDLEALRAELKIAREAYIKALGKESKIRNVYNKILESAGRLKSNELTRAKRAYESAKVNLGKELKEQGIEHADIQAELVINEEALINSERGSVESLGEKKARLLKKALEKTMPLIEYGKDKLDKIKASKGVEYAKIGIGKGLDFWKKTGDWGPTLIKRTGVGGDTIYQYKLGQLVRSGLLFSAGGAAIGASAAALWGIRVARSVAIGMGGAYGLAHNEKALKTKIDKYENDSTLTPEEIEKKKRKAKILHNSMKTVIVGLMVGGNLASGSGKIAGLDTHMGLNLDKSIADAFGSGGDGAGDIETNLPNQAQDNNIDSTRLGVPTPVDVDSLSQSQNSIDSSSLVQSDTLSNNIDSTNSVNDLDTSRIAEIPIAADSMSADTTQVDSTELGRIPKPFIPDSTNVEQVDSSNIVNQPDSTNIINQGPVPNPADSLDKNTPVLQEDDHVEDIPESEPEAPKVEDIADIKVSSKGAIATIHELKQKLGELYPNTSETPENIKHILETGDIDLTKEWGMFNPDEAKESAWMLKGSSITVDENGKVTLHNLGKGDTILSGEDAEKYSGKMFDSNPVKENDGGAGTSMNDSESYADRPIRDGSASIEDTEEYPDESLLKKYDEYGNEITSENQGGAGANGDDKYLQSESGEVVDSQASVENVKNPIYDQYVNQRQNNLGMNTSNGPMRTSNYGSPFWARNGNVDESVGNGNSDTLEQGSGQEPNGEELPLAERQEFRAEVDEIFGKRFLGTTMTDGTKSPEWAYLKDSSISMDTDGEISLSKDGTNIDMEGSNDDVYETGPGGRTYKVLERFNEFVKGQDVKPESGETVEAYLRRLAKINA